MSNATLAAGPLIVFRSLFVYKNLIWQMTKRDVAGRYRGSVFGLLWSFFNPILLMIVYTFVFRTIMRVRWGEGVGGEGGDFAVILFAGMLTHSLLAECAIKAPGLVVMNVNYVKRVVFPLEILPWVSMGSALFHTLVNIAVLLIFNVALNHTVKWTIVFTPMVLFPLVILTMGISWFLASIGVFLRDVGQTISLAMTVLMFLSPVLYPLSAIPERYQTLIYANPLTFIIEQMRATLLWGKIPDFKGLLIYFLASVIVGWGGYWWFEKTRKGFADVI